MKKKIIFVLSFLMMVLCLTGCGSTNVTSDEIREITEIAQNYKDIVGYELPDGYTCKIADNKRNDQIIIETNEKACKRNTLSLTFDISQEKVQLLNVEDNYDYEYNIVTLILFIVCVISYIAGMISQSNQK